MHSKDVEYMFLKISKGVLKFKIRVGILLTGFAFMVQRFDAFKSSSPHRYLGMFFENIMALAT